MQVSASRCKGGGARCDVVRDGGDGRSWVEHREHGT